MNEAVSRAGRRQGHAVGVDVVFGQPARERDIGAEDDNVVEAEPPDPHVLQRGKHLLHGRPLPGMRSGTGENHQGRPRPSLPGGRHRRLE